MVRQTAQIILPPKEKRAATFRIFQAKTSTAEEAERGTLFALFHIDYYHHRNSEIIDGIIEELETAYYDPETPVENPEKLLEEALRLLNTTIAHLIETEQIFLNIKRFHAVIGVTQGRTVIVSPVGDLRVFLGHMGKTGVMELMDIASTGEDKKKKETPPAHRLFSNILSGALRPRDVLLVTTPSLVEYLTKKQVAHAFVGGAPARALTSIKKLLKTGGERPLGICTFVIRIAPKEETEAAAPTSKESLKALFQTEEGTRAILAPSAVKKGARHIGLATAAMEKQLRAWLHISEQAPRRAILYRLLRYTVSGIRIGARSTLVISRALVQGGKAVAALFTTRGDWKQRVTGFARQAQQTMTPLMQAVKGRRTHLSVRHRALIIGAVVVLAVFAGSIGVSSYNKAKENKLIAYQQQKTQILERLTIAEASMIFKDEVRTRAIYDEAQVLVAALPRETEVERTTATEFEEKIERALSVLRRAAPLASLDILTDFTTLDPAVELRALARDGQSLYLSHATRPILYRVNLENNQVVTLNAADVDISPVHHLAVDSERKRIILAFDTAGLAGLKLAEDAVQPLAITFGGSAVDIGDIALFGDRLYLLDTAQNTIWRHNAKDDGFGSGSKWLTDTTDVRTATDMEIDGSIWFALPGRIVQLLRGSAVDWSISGVIDPPEMNLVALQIDTESDMVYALDQAHPRVLAFEKSSGAFRVQYPIPAETVRDFVFEQSTKTLLVATDTKLLTLTFE